MSRPGFGRLLALGAMATTVAVGGAHAQAAPAQRIDAEYTAKIKEYLTDPRITTELVDHLPASATVPTPLKFHGRIIGTPGELTYARDIHRYMKALADAAPTRAKYYVTGKSEEGRDMILLVIADEATIRGLNTNKAMLHELTDPRRTSEARARQIISTAKPVYYLTSGMHSTETGGPEMLQELAYRLIVEETPFIRDIRNNVITIITPVIEPDGREKIVDNCYMIANLGYSPGIPYWGKYVAHDNNRDGMGQYLELTKAFTRVTLDWRPQIAHDLHEQATLLYSSTGQGPYNENIDPITVGEWWLLAQNDVVEMTKRGVPGVWTYGFYDGWVPNYMFFSVHTRNATGRFYEVQSYNTTGCGGIPGSARAARSARVRDSAAAANPNAGGGGRGFGGRGGGGAGAQVPDSMLTRVLGGSNYNQSREWYRPNPTPDDIRWGPRANTNIQQSAVLMSLKNVAENRRKFLENYWIKNKNAVNKGTHAPVKAWVIPAGQRAKANVAESINELRVQGLEIHTADADFTVSGVDVKKGDYIVRGDQPFRTMADMYFSIQNYPTTNPAPYDDTGWTYQMMRNMLIHEIGDASIHQRPMTAVKSKVTAPGGIVGQAGTTIVVDHDGDNNLMTLRFRFPTVAMQASQGEFDAAGRKFSRGSFIIRNANRAQLEPVLRELGLTGYVAEVPATVQAHDLDVPRIGYIHSWRNTQNEGWVRAALDHYKVPYTYFGENEVAKMGNLRQRFDVILWPHGGNIGSDQPTTGAKTPYRRTAEYTAVGFPDSTDDTRGDLGRAGFAALTEFVRQGGTVITEGNTATIFTAENLTPGITLDNDNPGLVNRGTLLRGVIHDLASPIMYGQKINHQPIYFSGGSLMDVGIPQTPDLPAQGKVNELRPGSRAATMGAQGGRGGAGAPGGGRGGRGGGASPYQNVSPMATYVPHAVWEPTVMWPGTVRIANPVENGPRVIMTFPSSPKDMLLSGVLVGGEHLSNRAVIVDQQIGQGHVVMFANRPFWRWQTQGSFIQGFNAIMNWNDLGAGK
jgi:hypothetical protein